MKITFLGTRGGIKIRSPLHYMHSVLLIEYKRSALLIDWGADWLAHKPPKVDGLLISHAHDDHVGGLINGFPSPVFGNKVTTNTLKKYPLELHTIHPRERFSIGSFSIEPFAVLHSIRAPAFGYKITAGAKTIFYVSDLVSIVDEEDALTGVDVYIGDGALISRRMLVRKKQGTLVGHSPIIDQLAWCAEYNIPKMIVTHCGSEITKNDASAIADKIQTLSYDYDVRVQIAYDGMPYLL